MTRSPTGCGAVDGWLRNLGALDFAGGTVVHISSGVSALVFALVLGKRKGFRDHAAAPQHDHDPRGCRSSLVRLVRVQRGKRPGANGLAASALVVTNTATAMGGLAWDDRVVDSPWASQRPRPGSWRRGRTGGHHPGLRLRRRPRFAFDRPGAGIFCFFAVDILKTNIGVDDALDVFAVHGVGGIWGALATGLFAQTAINPAGADGLFYGNPSQLLKQAVAVVTVVVFTAAVTWIILKVIDVTVGLRVPEQEEVLGLDTTTHGEVAYQL